MDKRRKAVTSLGAVACAVLGSGSLALAALADGAPRADLQAPKPAADPAVVVERVFDDTYVVLGSTPTSVPTTRPRTSTTHAPVPEDPAPIDDVGTVTSTPSAPRPTEAPTTSRATTTTRPRATSTTSQPPTTTRPRATSTTVRERPGDDD